MNKKEIELLNVLSKKNNEWVTSRELAEYFNCSTRTIRNYVSNINRKFLNVIESSNIGYKINKNLLIDYQQKLNILNMQLNDRKSRILLELLKNSVKGIDLFDLSEKLFISESTLKNDIQELKQLLPTKTLKITIKNNIIKLDGSERSKRKFIVDLLYNEGNIIFEDLKTSIEDMIEYISIDELKNIIQDVLSDNNIFINQYSLNNIVLHFAVSIERIRQGNILPESDEEIICKKFSMQEIHLTEKITKAVSEKYNIQFPKTEFYQLALQFVGLYEKSILSNNNQINSYVNKKILSALRDALNRAEEIYLIDFDDTDFFNRLAIHLQSLFCRSKYQKFTRNSNLLDIKMSYPIIYDLSVYIASIIQENIDITFNEDEISFIALHIGSLLEKRQIIDQNYTKILLVANDYHGITNQLSEKITQRLGHLVKVKSISDFNDVHLHNFDLLVTTNRKIATLYNGAVFIRPFLTDGDLAKIEKRVDAKRKFHQKCFINKLIDKFFNKRLYFNQIDPSGLKVSEIVKRMNQVMMEHGYVDENFLNSIQKREQMSPTSFPSGVAVPHSVELNALVSGISILTLQEPILWSNHEVTLIALVAINKKESKEFNQLFEIFIEVVSEAHNVQYLSKSENFNEFITKLKLMINELIDNNYY